MSNSAISFNTAGLASATSPGLVGTGAQTFAGAKTFNNGLVFAASSLSDAQATIMGLKQYLHGTTYNNGVTLSLTSAQAGFTVARAVFVPYQMQDGTWRLKWNIRASFTSTAITSLTMTINGSFTFFDAWACCGLWGGVSNGVRAFVNSGTANLVLDSPSYTTGAISHSGDVEILGKPTWAY